MAPRPNFNDLRDLHERANDLLLSPTIQQALIHQQEYSSSNIIQEVQETILRILDSCGSTRDVLLLLREQVQDLRSASRRLSVGLVDCCDFEAKLSACSVERKKLKKEMVKCLRSLKEMKKCNKYLFTSDLSLIDHNLIVVVHVLRELRIATVSIVESLLGIIDSGIKSSFASKIMRPYMTCQRLFDKCEATSTWVGDDLEYGSRGGGGGCSTVKSSSSSLTLSFMLLEARNGRGSNMEDLEAELECIIRRLIQTRALLLNVANN